MDLKFSIIIPVYNVAPYLHECLDSVLAQTFADWEAICVDDGSTDGSGAILDEYAVRDVRFKVIRQENQGVAVARQVALDHCTGEWVCAVDSDDWVEPDFLKAFYDAICDGPVDMVWCDCWIDGAKGSRRYRNEFANDAEILLKALLEDRARGFLFTKAFSRKVLEESMVQFPPNGCDFAEDLVFCCRFLMNDPRVKWFDGCHYHYREREESLTHTRRSSRPHVNYAKSIGCLAQDLKHTAYETYAELIKQRVKFRMYDNPDVENDVFAQTFQEVRDISRMHVGWWHRILFKLAIWGVRGLAIRILRVVRFVRSIGKG